jgi:hypothetical protein
MTFDESMTPKIMDEFSPFLVGDQIEVESDVVKELSRTSHHQP